MAPPTKKDTLLWLLVTLCTAGIVLLWLPGFLNVVFDFTEEVGKRGKDSQDAFFKNLKEVQAEFEKGLDKQKKANQAKEQTQQAVQPLDEAQLAQIGKEIEAFAKNEERYAAAPITPKSFCTRQGGIYEERNGAQGLRYSACRFTDGTECHALLFMREKCHIGQYKKAEDGIPRWPDLALTVESMDYCKRIDGALTIVSKEQARGICINGLRVQNIGIAASKRALVRIDEKQFSVPPLKPQELFTVLPPVILQKTSELSTVAITLSTSFMEIDKENNTYQYAEKDK